VVEQDISEYVVGSRHECDVDTSSPSPSSRPPRPREGAPKTAQENAPILRTLNGGIGALGRLRDDTVIITGTGSGQVRERPDVLP
jgi:hypothetical protein